MRVFFWVSLFVLLGTNIVLGQELKVGRWKAALLREDGHRIVFNFDLSYPHQKPVLHIINAEERLEVTQVTQKKDSVFIEMPFFESAFFCQVQRDGSLKGIWVKGTSGKNVILPFIAWPGNEPRFNTPLPPKASLSGRWEMQFFKSPGEKVSPAIAELTQNGSKLTGSILNPDGDYRYLEGVVTGDSLFLSTFDGSHAYVFTGVIKDAQTIIEGRFYAGATSTRQFSAIKNAKAELSMESVALQLKPGQDQLDFRFPDLNGKLVGINDEKFRNKVVVVQIMGSWCPNCMDETRFLSDYYKKNHQRGIEMVALAYEYSTDNERSVKSLQKFKQRFSVDYPILITGVTSSDSLRTEKTLPQLTDIKSFPSTIFIGKDGKVKKVHGGFFGPATGEAYTTYIREFEETVEALLVQ
ncbi:peroxiredoxin family protein [Flavihumibacter fluvii]|uniref:peroxiredoxin family protein n=1 Tax=Flavihumibacter fluvii TaxID=2838157 RepID=UPI001BDF4E9C|nr:TlpA disulfide reductase family protein [Flavihumibacter fluvii]ULQ53508.1 TlpA family protein disulfide reductase [Flavihumibacter fluvii]